MGPRAIQITISTIAIIVAIVHVLLPDLTIDAITVTLIGIGVLPWLGPLFQSVELPGGLKVEFKELQEVRRKVEGSGLIREQPRPVQRHVYAFQKVSGNDANLALAGLRIEIESRLNAIAKARDINAEATSAASLTSQLEKAGAMSQSEAAAIRDLLPLLNQAAHGALVDPGGFDWAMDFGPQVLGALEDRLGETSLPQLIEAWKYRDGAGVHDVGTKLSKAFVEAPNAFLATMHEHPVDFREWIAGLGTHTFTVYEARSELEGDLYRAYYERLRELMLNAADSALKGDYAEEAEAIQSALRTIEVRQVW